MLAAEVSAEEPRVVAEFRRVYWRSGRGVLCAAVYFQSGSSRTAVCESALRVYSRATLFGLGARLFVRGAEGAFLRGTLRAGKLPQSAGVSQ